MENVGTETARGWPWIEISESMVPEKVDNGLWAEEKAAYQTQGGKVWWRRIWGSRGEKINCEGQSNPVK